MKILIVTKNWLGDILFEMPAVEMIRKKYPDAEIVCLTHPRCREMLEAQPSVDRVVAFDEHKENIFSKLRFVKKMRRLKIDRAYFFHRSRTRAFLLMLAGIKERIGFEIKKPNFLTLAIAEPPQALHHADHFVYLLTQTGFEKPVNPSYTFYYTRRDQDGALHLLKNSGIGADYVCFHLGANWEPKRWPAEHFAKLADLIHAKWKLPVILTGGPGDLALGEKVLSEVKHANVQSWIGKTTLGELAAIFSRSAFVVSGDSGPMHIASGAGARVAALFGPTSPELTGPRGIGERLVLSFIPKGYTVPWYNKDGKDFPAEGWLSQISPEEIMSALESRGWGNKKSGEFSPLISERKNNGEEGNILLITLSNIGDVILTTPVLTALAAQFPKHHLTVVAGPRSKGILEGSRLINRLIIYDKHAGIAEKINFIKSLRLNTYDVVVDLKNSAVPFMVKADKRSPFLRFFKETAARERHLEVLRWMGLETLPAPFDFYSPSDEAALTVKMQRKKIPTEKEYVVMVPLAASGTKSWPITSYEALIKRLLAETAYNVVLAGGPGEKEKLNSLETVDPSRVFNFAEETSLRELGALIDRSALLVANDSSAAQLSFEMNHPSVVIYGPTNFRKYARQGEKFRIVREDLSCSPCEKAQCPLERQACMLDLTPDKVFQACRELLSHSAVKVQFSGGTR